MDELTKAFEGMPNILLHWWDRFIAFSPKLVGAIILIIIGWGVAIILKTLSAKLTAILNRILNRFFSKGNLARPQLSQTITNSFSAIIFWGTLLFFATAAMEILGLNAFSLWFDRIVAYSPHFFAGALIIVFGVLLSVLGRDLVLSTIGATIIPYSRVLGGVVQGTILVTAIIIGADQLGIEVSFIVTLLSIILGAILGSLALALGFGTKDLVSNLISGHQLKKVYQPGQNVRFGNVEGTILELTPTSMVLSTEEGRTIVPAKMFHSDPSLLIIQETNKDE